MSYADIEKTKADREAKEAKEVKGKPSRKRKTSAPEALQITKKRKSELEVAEKENAVLEFGDCSVLQFLYGLRLRRILVPYGGDGTSSGLYRALA